MYQEDWVNRLLNWFDQNQRKMPWRATADSFVEPWKTWISEVMLQQTTVATVNARYIEFMERWPSFEHLSYASEDEILHFWQGLGYYSRARNLYKAIQYIKNENKGILPDSFKELKKIPGLGDYTAAAIAAIAFNKKEAVVDGNVSRVLARFWMMQEAGEKLKKKQREMLQAYIPDCSGDFAQSLIELGALICRPKNPKCQNCPLKLECAAFLNDKIDIYPVKQHKKLKEKRKANFYIIINKEEEALFFKRPEKGLLASLYVLPSNNWYMDDSPDIEKRIASIKEERLYQLEFKHIFTHIELMATVYLVKIEKKPIWNDSYWIKKKDIENLALPTMIKKALIAF